MKMKGNYIIIWRKVDENKRWEKNIFLGNSKINIKNIEVIGVFKKFYLYIYR